MSKLDRMTLFKLGSVLLSTRYFNKWYPEHAITENANTADSDANSPAT